MKKLSADFRRIARESLSKKWGIAIGVGLLASLLGGAGIDGVSFTYKKSFEIDTGTVNYDISSILNIENQQILNITLISILIAAVIFVFAYSLLGSIIQVGYSKFNLQLVDKSDVNVNSLFKYFSNWKNIICTDLLVFLYVTLWSLFLIIPGIVATYSYAMTSYVLAENPELTATEAIQRSKELMKGNRYRLFCLHLSFIGWDFLCAFTLGIGDLWLKPYKHASIAAFYREISDTNITNENRNI